MRAKAYRRKMKKQKEDRLRNVIERYGYCPHIGYIENDTQHIKYPKNSNKKKYLKKQSNRKVRKSVLPQKGNAYRKSNEYWWIMY